jgi:hypothetical protein
MSKSVLLFKAVADDDDKSDSYVRSIQGSFDLNVCAVAVLKFIFKDEQTLRERLQCPDDFTGIILTRCRLNESVSSFNLEFRTNFNLVFRTNLT